MHMLSLVISSPSTLAVQPLDIPLDGHPQKYLLWHNYYCHLKPPLVTIVIAVVGGFVP